MLEVPETNNRDIQIANLQSDLGYVRKEVQKLCYGIEGNGHLGITDRVTALEKKMWVIWGLGVLVVTVLTSISAYVIVTQLKQNDQKNESEYRIQKLENKQP